MLNFSPIYRIKKYHIFNIFSKNTKYGRYIQMDEKDFFIEITRRICGSLEIEKALHRCLMYIRDFIPADQAYLTYYDPESEVIRVFAMATIEGGHRSKIRFPLSPSTKTWQIQKSKIQEVYLVNRPEEHPLIKNALEFFGEDSSLLIMRLIVEKEFVGALVLRTDGRDRYSKDHARLLGKLNESFTIALANSRKHQEILELKDLLVDDNRYLKNELSQRDGEEIIGTEFGLKGVMDMVRKVARLSSPVLLLGETGTGKELIATAIHNSSARSEGPFIKVNCGAIPETLIDSELFGHEKGAFTGAITQKRGRFERAHGGTIFLDEIGELIPEAQVKLLRVLQEKEIERVGGTNPVKVDIRVIAATHRDLEAMLSEEQFREDLYYRLKVFPIVIPSLKERVADIPALIQHFMQKKSREMGLPGIPVLADRAIERLLSYNWPGNVRELENVVERALIISGNEPLSFNDLQTTSTANSVRAPIAKNEPSLNLDNVVSLHIHQVMDMTDGKIQGKQGAARLLGVKPNTLRHRMMKLGIPFGRKAKKSPVFPPKKNDII